MGKIAKIENCTQEMTHINILICEVKLVNYFVIYI